MRKMTGLFCIMATIGFIACSTTKVAAQELSPEHTKELERKFPTRELYI